MQKISPLRSSIEAFNKFKALRAAKADKTEKTNAAQTNPFGITFTPSPILRERIDRGIGLYNLGAAPKLLMSGDHGRVGYNEVGVMKTLAIDAGIPSQDVFMDHAGFSTYESLYRARDVFCAKRVIIVSQKYHLYRALYIADQLGLEAYGVGADVQRFYGQTTREMRESLARVKDFLYCAVKPLPTYLGETIPVSGNGDLTND